MSTNGVDNHDCKCCPGPTGQTGPQGPWGPQGVPGAQGPRGLQGLQGPKGADGVKGDTGLPGLTGASGPQGPKGDTGLPGAAGANGLQGPQGLVGATGPAGLQGPKGDTGAAGNDGLQGPEGSVGAVGPMGPQGPRGEQGTQGLKGDCVECPCGSTKPEYAMVFSLVSQVLSSSPGLNMPGQAVLFEKSIVSTANIDVSMASVNGQITVKKKGWYRVNKAVSAALTPIGIPLNVWSMALFINGKLMDGSCFANMTISPDQQMNQTTASVIYEFDVGDVVTLNNTSVTTLHLNAIMLGSNVAPLSASFNMFLLETE